MIEEWHNRIDLVTAEVIGVCQHLDHGQFNRRPSPDRWSIAQVMDHISTVNRSYALSFEQLEHHEYPTPWHGKIPFIPKLLGSMILNSVKPDNKRKVRTLPRWEPARSDLPMSVSGEFIATQKWLKSWITTLFPTHVRTVVASPANRMIVYPLSMAIEILVTHEERHLLQIRSVTNQVLVEEGLS